MPIYILYVCMFTALLAWLRTRTHLIATGPLLSPFLPLLTSFRVSLSPPVSSRPPLPHKSLYLHRIKVTEKGGQKRTGEERGGEEGTREGEGRGERGEGRRGRGEEGEEGGGEEGRRGEDTGVCITGYKT